MQIAEGLIRQMLDAKPSKSTCRFDAAKCERLLEAHLYLRSVAGENFDKVIAALKLATENNRGLLVIGKAGCGKTQLMRALWQIQGHDDPDPYKWVYCKDQGHMGFLRAEEPFYYDVNVYMDDLGSEEVLNEYGNQVDVVGDFIQHYYDHRKRARFYGTTNLGYMQPIEGAGTNDTILKRYGARVADRLGEMCVVLKLSGGSRREKLFVK